MGIQGAHYIVNKVGFETTVVLLQVPTSGYVSALGRKGFLDTVAEIAPNPTILTYVTQFTREDRLKDLADILSRNSKIDAVCSMMKSPPMYSGPSAKRAAQASRSSPEAAVCRNTSSRRPRTKTSRFSLHYAAPPWFRTLWMWLCECSGVER